MQRVIHSFTCELHGKAEMYVEETEKSFWQE